MVRIPDKETYRRVWAEMSRRERGDIMRAVRRGDAMRRRKDARLAVYTARQQQNYWKWAWLVAPLVALVALPNWYAVAVQAVVLTGLMGGVARYFFRQAQKAEQANIERIRR